MYRGGIKEAAKLLAGLDRTSQRSILEIIEKKNPEMAQLLRDNMISLEDLQYLTVKMLQELLQEIKLADLGLALRISSKDLREHILLNVSKTIRKDLEDILTGPPQAVSKVEEAAMRVLDIVRDMADKGKLVLSKSGSEEYV